MKDSIPNAILPLNNELVEQSSCNYFQIRQNLENEIEIAKHFLENPLHITHANYFKSESKLERLQDPFESAYEQRCYYLYSTRRLVWRTGGSLES